jgi:hypothetical protein
VKSPVMLLLLLPVLVLAACGGPQVEAPLEAPGAEAPQVDTPLGEVQTENAQAMIAVAQETLVDEQGAVSVAITPLEVAQDAATLSFEVAMNTHSVDLGMDLAQLATLTTDTGAAVTATTWTGEAGGHHVSGVLSFPTDNDGAPLLEGATTITLTLENVDARERIFTWRVQ